MIEGYLQGETMVHQGEILELLEEGDLETGMDHREGILVEMMMDRNVTKTDRQEGILEGMTTGAQEGMMIDHLEGMMMVPVTGGGTEDRREKSENHRGDREEDLEEMMKEAREETLDEMMTVDRGEISPTEGHRGGTLMIEVRHGVISAGMTTDHREGMILARGEVEEIGERGRGKMIPGLLPGETTEDACPHPQDPGHRAGEKNQDHEMSHRGPRRKLLKMGDGPPSANVRARYNITSSQKQFKFCFWHIFVFWKTTLKVFYQDCSSELN